jgi:hypothetical protein
LPDRSCPSCGGDLPGESRFCPHCGTRLASGPDETAVIEPPPDETGPVPVQRDSVQPHLFGVTPPMALFALAAAALAVGILLVVVGRLVTGAVVLALGALLLVAFVRAAQRKPDSGLARASTTAVGGARDRFAVAYAGFSARARARRRVAAVRVELLRLGDRRRELLLALGRAVYESDAAATGSLRTELAELDRTAAEKEAEMATIVEQARAEVGRAQLEVQPTEMVEVPGSPGVAEPAPGEAQPPEPARVPEPYPPPGEGDPPGPARVPEPYPPPDEGDPPEPARVPEPGGDGR